MRSIRIVAIASQNPCTRRLPNPMVQGPGTARRHKTVRDRSIKGGPCATCPTFAAFTAIPLTLAFARILSESRFTLFGMRCNSRNLMMLNLRSWLKSRLGLAVTLTAVLAPLAVEAHPHVFADARLELTIAPDGTVDKLAHIWRFDDVFSSTVLMEFDKNGDLQLDKNELIDLGHVINSSIAEFKYFQTVLADGKDVKMARPNDLAADFSDNHLLIVLQASLKSH